MQYPLNRPLKYPLLRGLQRGSGGGGGSPPVNTVAPVISGTSPYYVGSTLTTTDGTWTGSPAPTFTYQWRLGGVNISGQTANTYVIQNDNMAGSVDCVVTASNGNLPDASQASNALTIFTPASVAGGVANVVWHDMADTSTITQVAGAVSLINDKFGNGVNYNSTQATGVNQPITGTRTLNGRNVLDFDGTAMFLNYGTSVRTQISGTAETTFIVYMSDKTTGTQSLCIFNNGGSASKTEEVTATAFVTRTTTAGALVYTVAGNTNPHIVGNILNLANRTAFYDGNTATDVLGVAGVYNNASRIGATSTATNLLDGIVAEVIHYKAGLSTGLSTSDINLVGQYLSSKWGIAWTNF